MGLFGLFKPSATTIARVNIEFPGDFETSSMVSVFVQGGIPAGIQVWIWDLYYAKTLFNLGASEGAEGVKTQLEMWAEERVTVLMSGLPGAPELLVLDADLVLSSTPIPRAEVYRIDVMARDKEWPLIQTHLPAQGFQNRAAYSILAFAQYLIDRDPRQFAREFPVHVLAMRKFYSEVKPYTRLASVLEAPTHAINSAMELFKDMNR